MYTLSTNGVKLIHGFESLELKPYKDKGGRWTIGWGHVILPGEEYLMAGITAAKADELFAKDAGDAIYKVNKAINVPLNQNQFDALVSFFYNAGSSETLVKLINANAGETAIRNFWENHYITVSDNEGNHIKVTGLQSRRKSEADFFFGEGLQAVLIKNKIRSNLILIIAVTLTLTIATFIIVKRYQK